MKRTIIRVLALVTVLIMVCTACAKESETSSSSGTNSNVADPITFKWFIPDPNAKIVPEDSPILQQIFEATGVKFERVIPPAEPKERLNLMLAGGDIPDLITFWDSSIMKQYIQADKIVKLNDLLTEFAPNTFNINLEKDVKRKMSDENGDFWFLPGGYTFGDTMPEAGNAFNVRTDYWEENGYKVPKTIAEYADLLRNIKKYNTEIIPMGLALGPQGHIDRLVEVAAAANGLNYYEARVILDESTNKLIHYSQSSEIKDFFKYLNGLNLEGLIDPESPIMSAEMLKQKVVGEQIWSFIGPWWEINSEVIAYEESIDSLEQSVYTFPTANESISVGTYAPYSVNMFSCGLTITTSNKDPERFMKFYEYANTEEGWMNLNGIINFDFTGENTVEATENYDYIARSDMVEDGKKAFEASAWMGEMWGNDENWYWNRGVECFGEFTYNGFTQVHPNSKYYLPPVDVSVWWDDNSTRINNEIGWTGKNYNPKMAEMGVDNSAFADLVIDSSSSVYTKYLAVIKAHEETLPRVIMASSAENFETEWTNYTKALDNAGLNDVMDTYNKLHQTRLEQWKSAE